MSGTLDARPVDGRGCDERRAVGREHPRTVACLEPQQAGRDVEQLMLVVRVPCAIADRQFVGERERWVTRVVDVHPHAATFARAPTSEQTFAGRARGVRSVDPAEFDAVLQGDIARALRRAQ